MNQGNESARHMGYPSLAASQTGAVTLSDLDYRKDNTWLPRSEHPALLSRLANASTSI